LDEGCLYVLRKEYQGFSNWFGDHVVSRPPVRYTFQFNSKRKDKRKPDKKTRKKPRKKAATFKKQIPQDKRKEQFPKNDPKKKSLFGLFDENILIVSDTMQIPPSVN